MRERLEDDGLMIERAVKLDSKNDFDSGTDEEMEDESEPPKKKKT
jgi:hypothetical protein